ncbi:ABC transporter permease [Pontibacter sp. G13]|uniref:ABC transporter permease n=1 Tax=Pontibacter sp. G13 TaxID=3074898 RepID=UPI00288B5444|nr:ABC transporter permease [Pontibacter sp. G13]WNJ19744.1 ABC transporter permease [Pontibacter sp. G13]
MLKNFITMALRTMRRQWGYTLLNMLGLTIGIGSTLLISLFLLQELSYDQYHERKDRIYRVSSAIAEPDNAFRWASTQFPLGPWLEGQYPEVEAMSRFVSSDNVQLQYEDHTFIEEDIYLCDSAVFDMFSFEFLAGDPSQALTAPNSIVLSETLADKYFGSAAEALGKVMKRGQNGEDEVKVTGVYRDMPTESHIIANAMYSILEMDEEQSGGWGSFYLFTYVMLTEGSDGAAFAAKLPEVIEGHVAPIFERFGITVDYELMGITELHLHSTFEGEPTPKGNPEYIFIFSIVAVFMLLIACINYMNLATARSSKRAKEVGIRKVMGSLKGQLVGQFMSESVILAILAAGLSIAFVYAAVPMVNNLLVTPIRAGAIWRPELLLLLAGMILAVGVLSGIYPAFFLASFKPVSILKGKFIHTKGGSMVRKGLVVFQFVISLGLLVCTGIVYDQLQYVQEKELGFTMDPILRFSTGDADSRGKWMVLREELLSHPYITHAATSSSSPGQGYSKNLLNVQTEEGPMDQKGVDMYFIDFDFMETMDMKLVEGRNLDSQLSTDSSLAVLVNEAFVKRMSWTEPIGKKVQQMNRDSMPMLSVVGVIRDFHQNSLYNPIEPLMLFSRSQNGQALVRIDRDHVKESLAHVESSWNKLFPNMPFEYEFLDEEFAAQYESDEKQGYIFTLFSILTVIIACLGLLGLASFSAEQRTKEIGVRKVIGASVGSLLVLLTKEFFLLVCLSMIFAFPLAWWAMDNWLESFAYRTDFQVLTFIGALVITLMVTLLATGYHALKAARANPIEALKYE